MQDIYFKSFVSYLALNRPGFTGNSISWEDGVKNKTTRYTPEVRERAERDQGPRESLNLNRLYIA
jgi:hypothetical protein